MARNFVHLTLKQMIQSRWPAARLDVEIFGSIASALDDANSDLDLMIVDPARPLGIGMPMSEGSATIRASSRLPEWYDPSILAEVFRRAPGKLHIKDIKALAKARIPMVRLSMDSYGLNVKVDLVVNNRLAIE